MTVSSYADALEAIRSNLELMKALQIDLPIGDADLMLTLLKRLDSAPYVRRVKELLSEEKAEALLEMVSEDGFILDIARSVDGIYDVADIVSGDSVLKKRLAVQGSPDDAQFIGTLILHLTIPAYVRKALDYYTDRVFKNAEQPPLIPEDPALDADAILDVAVDLHNRTYPTGVWTRRNVEVGDLASDDTTTIDFEHGRVEEVYFQGISGDSSWDMPSPVRLRSN